MSKIQVYDDLNVINNSITTDYEKDNQNLDQSIVLWKCDTDLTTTVISALAVVYDRYYINLTCGIKLNINAMSESNYLPNAK